VGAVVGWDVSQEGDDLHVTVEWLGAGATFSEMTASLGVSTDERDFIQNWTPVYGAMPTLKWRYGHVIRDTQRIPLHDGETVQEVRLSLFDAFTGQVVAPVGREGGSVMVFP